VCGQPSDSDFVSLAPSRMTHSEVMAQKANDLVLVALVVRLPSCVPVSLLVFLRVAQIVHM
jgi:hypothetical protein